MSKQQDNSGKHKGPSQGQFARDWNQPASRPPMRGLLGTSPDFYGHRGNALPSYDYNYLHGTPAFGPRPQTPIYPPVNQPGNTAPYQITLSFNTPAPQAPANPNLIQPNQPQFDNMQASYHPPRQGQSYNDAPPPYTPHAGEAPPSSHLNTHDFDRFGKTDYKQGSKQDFLGGRRGSRMRGNFSQSCNNLSSAHRYRVTDDELRNATHSDFQRRGQEGAERGASGPSNQNNKNKNGPFFDHGQKKDSKGMNDFDDNISEKSFSGGDRPHDKRGRGGRGRGGWRGGRGRGGNYRRGSEIKKSSVSRLNLDEEHGIEEGYGGFDNDVHLETSRSEKDFCQSKPERNQRGRGSFQDKRGKRGSYDKGSKFRHGQDLVSGSQQEEDQQKLCVTLHFKTCFENATVLKSHIEATMKIPKEAYFQLSFDEFRLRHRENEAICKFTICSKKLALAKDCVKNTVTALMSKLETFIKLDFEEYDCSHSRSSEASSDFGNDQNNLHKNEGKTAVAVAENVSKSERHKKIAHKSQAKATKSDAKENIILPMPVPTSVDLAVEKSFSSQTGFKTFIRNAASDLRFDFEIVDDSVIVSAQMAKCCIRTKSKADARKMTQLFNLLQKQTQLNMTYSTFKTGDNSRSTSKEDELQLKLKQTKSSVALEMSKLIQNHEEKIAHLKTKLLERSSEESSKKSDIDYNALSDRLTLAEKQKEVFLAYYKILRSKLEKLDSTMKKEDLTHLQTLFQIECKRLVNAFPVYAYRDIILQQVKSNQVSIIIGESGNGKSTQIIQYLFDAGYAMEGTIVCTQPDHLSAVITAEKVAKDLSVKVGSLVGYKSNLGFKANRGTKILLATDQLLLNEFIDNRSFKKYSCIIIDEAQKHSMHTDLLLGIIKYYIHQQTSEDLKVIILSSPADSGVFVKYFDTCKEVSICCRHFDVDAFFSEDSLKDVDNYEEKAVTKALEIHLQEGPGDILVFLSLPIETLRCCQEFDRRSTKDKRYKCLPLHNQLPPEELKKIFIALPKGQRKIIFATKIAETTFTVDGIKYIVDTGLTSETKYDREQKINLTKICPVSRTSAILRKNLAGCSADGKCYRLYSKKSFVDFVTTSIPEVLRVHLEKAILKVYELGIKLKSFEFIHDPSGTAVNMTLETLKEYGAILNDQVTETGKWISKLPFDPMLGFFVCEAKKSNLLYDAIVLASIISLGGNFSFRYFSETDSDVEARTCQIFGFAKMDSFAWFEVYKTLSRIPKEEKAKWCRESSINYKSINIVHLCVEEVRSILLKDFNIRIPDKFSDTESAIVALKKLHMKSKYPHPSIL